MQSGRLSGPAQLLSYAPDSSPTLRVSEMAGFGEIFPVAKILTEVPPHDRPIVCLLTVYTVLARVIVSCS